MDCRRSPKRSEEDNIYTTRKISHEEAEQVAQRLINSHFRREPHARVGIPARPDYDDDLLICAYIKQQAAISAAPSEEELERFCEAYWNASRTVPRWKDEDEDQRETVRQRMKVALSLHPRTPEGWQPIASAPRKPVRNGYGPTIFLLVEGEPQIGCWDRDFKNFYMWGRQSMDPQPSYWMPIPASPSPQRETGK